MDKIILFIIGTNNFDDYDFFEENLYKILEPCFEKNYKIIIREQENNLTDGFSVRFAKENNIQLERYKVQWDKLGKKAGFENIKNILWGKEGNQGVDLLLGFQNRWDSDKAKFLINQMINEFHSIINLEDFKAQNYYIFTKR